MAKQSLIPEDILQYRPCKCCRIRNDNGVYRVYKYSSVKLDNGTWSSNWGYLIGKIIPGKGFTPNKRYLKELEKEKQLPSSDSITDVAYGQYSFLSFISQDVLEMLEKIFGLEKAGQIYSYAIILCANGFLYMDQIDEVYKESYLSLMFKNYSFKMGYTALSSLLHDLGLKTNSVKTFEQLLIDNSSKNVAIDGHVIRSCSIENDLAEPGYKLNQIKAPQVNLLIAYDIKLNVPLMYRTFRGSNVDKVSVIDLLNSRSFMNTKFVVDRGFYSTNVISLMSQNGNQYIIPVSANNKHYKRMKKNLNYSSGEFIYKAGKKNSARIVFYEERINTTTRIIAYRDEDENNSKRKNYQQLMALGENGYTQANYDKYCEWWGVYFLQTNTEDPASVVYSDYKDRWSIETYNNYIKNDANFQNLKFQDYYAEQGFDFIMLVTGLIHSKLNAAVKSLNKPNISTYDLLTKAGHMRMVLEDDEWHLRNIRVKDLELLAELKYVPQKVFTP